MAFETTNESVGEGRTLYTGMTKVNILTVNPTNEELENLGYNVKNKDTDPVYFNEKTNSRLIKFLFNATTKDKNVIKGDVSFFIGNKGVASKPGNVQYVDAKGNFKWFALDDSGNPITAGVKYFDINTMDLAYSGEEFLISFLKTLLDIKKDKECRLDNMASLYENGDVTEIKNLLNTFNNKRNIGVALGVKQSADGEKFYQVVYNKAFERAWSKNFDRLILTLDSDIKEGYIKDFYGYSPYNLTIFNKEQLTNKPNIPVSTVVNDLPF